MLVTCPRCDGEGIIGWNPTSPRDPQFDEDDSCPLCSEECVVAVEDAEMYLDLAGDMVAVDGWSASDYDPPRHPVPALSWGDVPW